MEKSIEKALEDAGLRERDVTPFMRVRVVGLTGKDHRGKGSSKEGIITIWNPTEKQVNSSVLFCLIPISVYVHAHIFKNCNFMCVWACLLNYQHNAQSPCIY